MSKNRLSADPYDSAGQPFYTNWQDRDGFLTFLGRMRLDAVLYEKIVVNDASVFEGVFFLYAAMQDDLLAELPWDNIEIKARTSTTLDDCILQWFSRPGEKKLVPVYHPSLSTECDVAHLSSALGQEDASEINSLDAYVSVLKSVGVPSEIADRQLEAWRRLERFRRGSNIALTPWQQGFNFEQHLLKSRGYAASVIETSLGQDTFARIWQDRALRSVVYSHLDRARLGAPTKERKDVETIKTWYDIAYKTAQARKNGCDSLEIHVNGLCRPYTEPELPIEKRIAALKRDEVVEIPRGFLKSLGTLPRKNYELLKSNVVAQRIGEWRALRQNDGRAARYALRKAMSSLVESVQAASPFHDDDQSSIGPSITGVAASAVAASATEETISKLGSKYPFARSLIDRRFFLVGASAALGFVTGTGVERLLTPAGYEQDVVEAIVRMDGARLHG
jgi:hypothetical protein